MSAPSSNHAVSLPAPALRRYIAHYAGFFANNLTAITHAALPSRHVHLIISLDKPIDVLGMPNAFQPPAAFAALVSGLQDAPSLVRNDGNVHCIHVFLTPFGVRALLGVPGEELACRVLDFSELWGRSVEELIGQLQVAGTWMDRFAILNRRFSAALRPLAVQSEIAWAWERLAQTHGSISVEHLAREVGWGRRHLSERFRTELGVTPKIAARIFRFERSCWLMKIKRPNLSQLALDCGYYDQAHMTREWNDLAMCTPKSWMAEQLPFLQDYELAGCDDGR